MAHGSLWVDCPGKSVESIAQRLQTGRPSVRFLVVSTLVEYRGGACQGLHTAGAGVAIRSSPVPPTVGGPVVSLLEEGSQRSGCQGGVGLQKAQCGFLQEPGEQRQRHGIGGLETDRQLIDQAGLHVNQAILVTHQGLELLDTT